MTAIVTEYVGLADVISLRGKEYVILAVNPKNYRAADAEGKTWNVPRNAFGIKVERHADWAWYERAYNAKKESNPGIDKIGTEVEFKSIPATKKFAGKRGLVCKVNDRTVSVVIKGLGIVNSSRDLLTIID